MTLKSPREELRRWQSNYSPVMPLLEETAERQLQAAGLTGEMREGLLSRLSYNGGAASIRFLASYSDLQSLDRIDAADTVTPLEPTSHAALCRTVFQAAEIALLNISELSERTRIDLEASRIGEAEEKYRWVSALQRTLSKFADLLMHFPSFSEGAVLSVKDSDAFVQADNELGLLRTALIDGGLIEGTQIVDAPLYQPGRNITHQAFADLVFEDLWKEGLGNIIIPDVYPGETPVLPYRKFVGADHIRLSVCELDHVGDTFFRQFRAYHQMSEIFAKQANYLLAEVIDELTGQDASLPKAVVLLKTAQAFLDFLPENLNPLLEILSVSQYQKFREALGITSGAHSPNIRKSLFNVLYPAVVRSVEDCVKANNTDQSLTDNVSRIHEQRFESPHASALVSLCEGAIALHGTLKRWRDLHFQFVKAHLGMSESAPTASVSGAKYGAQTVAKIRENAHSNKDPIVPLYEAIYCKPYQPASPFTPYNPASFAGKITARTSELVKITSAAIEDRIVAKTKSKIREP